MNAYDLSSNDYYRGLNRRFDRRAARLRYLGFRYESNEWGGFFVRRHYGRNWAIPASLVAHADNRAFYDRLRSSGVMTGWPKPV